MLAAELGRFRPLMRPSTHNCKLLCARKVRDVLYVICIGLAQVSKAVQRGEVSECRDYVARN